MQANQIPAKFPVSFGQNAGSQYILPGIIPVNSSDPTRASMSTGFPPATATPVAAGGTPPNIADFNRILQQITAWQQWVQAGGAPLQYDGTFQSGVGGYPLGALVMDASVMGLMWLSTADNNMTVPGAGGATWVVYPSHGSLAVTATGSSTWTVPPAVYWVTFEAWGGGGGAIGTPAGSSGAGGGYAAGTFRLNPGTVANLTVGAGGAGTTPGNTPGYGLNSSVVVGGTLLISGFGGSPGSSGPGPGGGGSGPFIIQGQGGSDLDNATCFFAVGGNSPRGGMGGTLNSAGVGLPPTVPGGGGGANNNVNQGQDGANGMIMIWW